MERELFISYSRRDIDLVKQIKSEIEDAVGIECWMDLNGIESGSPQFTKDIVDGINKCKVFVFMLTEHSQESDFALRELNYAYKKKEKQGKHVVIININDCQLTDEFELMYGLTDTISWTNKPQHDKFIRDLNKWTANKGPLIEITTEAGQLMKVCQDLSLKSEEGLSFFAARNFTNLKIHGEMNARDFYFLKSFCTMLEYLDLSDVKIKAYNGPYGTMHDYHSMDEIRNVAYEDNEIPAGAFFYWIPKDEGMPSLLEITLPEGITQIRRNAFARAYNLRKINIPKGVTKLDWVSFCCCFSLKHIEIPSTVVELEDQVFSGTPLSEVHVKNPIPAKIGFEPFGPEKESKRITLYVPKGSSGDYKKSEWSKHFEKIVEE